MKIYREVLIESADQAEALPYHTIAPNEIDGNGDTVVFIKVAFNCWVGIRGEESEDDERCMDEHVVGMTVLTPVEAKKERVKDYFFDCPGWHDRLVTSWEKE